LGLLVTAMAVLVTACPTGGGSPWIASGTCFGGFNNTFQTNTLDGEYVGPDNTAGNVTSYESRDGSCTGATVGNLTLVRAADQSTADGLCATLTPSTPLAFNLVAAGVVTYTPAMPADAWGCVSVVPTVRADGSPAFW